ncbi:hypothetical protein ACWGAN_18110 [Streptomyces sp. NPDC054945]
MPAETAADLLPKHALSTKAGFVPSAGGTEHSLDPSRLRPAIEKAAQELGREPDTALLHNPERSLTSPSPADGQAVPGRHTPGAAQAVAGHVDRSGASAAEEARPLGTIGVDALPSPDFPKVRAGFLVGIDLLDTTAVPRNCSNPPTPITARLGLVIPR